jgi:mannose-6-phosphate isomerase
MVIALTPFEALCGFRPIAEISSFLSTIAPLRRLVGNSAVEAIQLAFRKLRCAENTNDGSAAIKQAWEALMNAEQQQVTSCVEELIDTATIDKKDFAKCSRGELTGLFLQLEKQYGKDIGLFAVFFMNYIRMMPGEALFVRPNELHAYLSGGMSPAFELAE